MRVIDQRVEIAAQSAGIRTDDAENEGGSDCRVDRVAAALQNAEACLACETMPRDNDAMRALGGLRLQSRAPCAGLDLDARM